MITLDTPLQKVVGAKTAQAFAKLLDLHTAGDLAYHFPRRYDERGRHTDISALAEGDQVTVLAQVKSARSVPIKQGTDKMVRAVIGDSSGGTLTLSYFGKRQRYRERQLLPGRWGLFAGKVSRFGNTLQLNHAEYVLFADADAAEEDVEEFIGALIPIYPVAGDIKTWTISRSIRTLLDVLTVEDPVPATIRASRRLADLGTALHDIHRPDSTAALARARHRLKWDEAFAVQVTLVRRKLRAASWPARPHPRMSGGLLDTFDAGLPYELTSGQRAVGEEIAADLATAHPMHRLLQGEVGSGKTLCALRAMLQVVDAGGQAAMLAPTEVLAAQHHRGIVDLLGPMGRAGELGGADLATRVALVTGSLGAAARRGTLREVASGEAGIVVGTHALLYEGVEFNDLGLVVVDEQHRFGVEQRDALRAKAEQPPHVLVMTATPIPRTVAMTVYGDLEVSTLAELPRGRSPIASHVVPAAEKPAYLDRAWRRLREEVAAGHQAYVVCPRIGESVADGEDVSGIGVSEPGSDRPGPGGSGPDEPGRRPPLAVLDVAPLLESGPLHGLRLGVLHGRLPADEKDAVMRAFAAGELDVLVATTVVEVGVDVPNATVMIVLDADRFGVSQLHQLRGRVGRGRAPGLCLLVSDAPAGHPSRVRLDAVAATVDGFRLAELDLEQRREGDVLGATQSGRRSHLRLLSLLRDVELIRDARAEAIDLVSADPDLTSHPALARAVASLVDEERAEYLEKG